MHIFALLFYIFANLCRFSLSKTFFITLQQEKERQGIEHETWKCLLFDTLSPLWLCVATDQKMGKSMSKQPNEMLQNY